MKKSRLTDSQVQSILKQAESGTSVVEFAVSIRSVLHFVTAGAVDMAVWICR